MSAQKVQEIADRPRRSDRALCGNTGCHDPNKRVRYDDVLRGRYHVGRKEDCPQCTQERANDSQR